MFYDATNEETRNFIKKKLKNNILNLIFGHEAHVKVNEDLKGFYSFHKTTRS